ncbi:deoxynucleotide monophosphate kinase family protein [Pseudomonas viridiflava]|uniref:deoxynucleotide monophosphate kinase family protein n=1 Tax=Pseudomonas viridiflava TaxID=33069 RepID=UPI0018EF1E77|nr:deoxynucleotide monophosphate kinase [Pseudomonas viridiflava]
MKKILGLAAKARSGKDTAASFLLAHPGVAAYALADPLKRGCQALFALTDAQAWDDTVKERTLDAWGQSPREFFQRVGTEWMRAHNSLHWLKRADLEINGMAGHPDTSPSPHAQNPISATDPDAPFIKAVSAIFGLPDRSWDADLRSIPDEYWKISPEEMLQILKVMTYSDFPDFDAQRARHIQNNSVESSDNAKSPVRVPSFDATGKDIIIIKDIRFENEAHFIRTTEGEIWHIVRDNVESVKAHSSEAGIQIKQGDVVIPNNGTLEDYLSAIEKEWLILKSNLANNKTLESNQTPSNTRSLVNGQSDEDTNQPPTSTSK